MSVAVTVPNGAVPQVPLQKSVVREKVNVFADADVARPQQDSKAIDSTWTGLMSFILSKETRFP
jgi:hypothetical protein